MAYRVLRNVGTTLAKEKGIPAYAEGQVIESDTHGVLLASLHLAEKVIEAVPPKPSIKAVPKSAPEPETKTTEPPMSRLVSKKPTPNKDH